MLRKLFVASVLGLFLLPAVASAQFNQGDWEMTLNGSGTSSKEFDRSNVGVGGSVGYFLTKELEASVRDNVNYTNSDVASDIWQNSVRLAGDFHFDLDRWQPFVGANIGFGSGRQPVVRDGWTAAPEAGVKYFVNATTFIFGLIEYDISLRNADDALFAYAVGIGFKF